MTTWTQDEIDRIGNAEEVTIATRRQDGTLRRPVIIWLVRVGNDLYIRSVNGRDAAWFRGVQARNEGRIEGGGTGQDVTLEDIGTENAEAIDAAYWDKYARYPGIVPTIVTPDAQAATLRLVLR